MANGLRWDNIPESRVSSSARDDAINIEVMNRGMDRFIGALNKFNTRKNDRAVEEIERSRALLDADVASRESIHNAAVDAYEAGAKIREKKTDLDAEKALAVLESGAYNAGSNLKKKQTLGQFLHDSKMYQGLPKEVQGRVSKGLQDVWRQGNQDALTERNRAQELALRRESNALQRYQLNRQIAADKKAAEDAMYARGEHIKDPKLRQEFLNTLRKAQNARDWLAGGRFKDSTFADIIDQVGVDKDDLAGINDIINQYNMEHGTMLPVEGVMKQAFASGKSKGFWGGNTRDLKKFLDDAAAQQRLAESNERYITQGIDPYAAKDGKVDTLGYYGARDGAMDLELFRRQYHPENAGQGPIWMGSTPAERAAIEQDRLDREMRERLSTAAGKREVFESDYDQYLHSGGGLFNSW